MHYTTLELTAGSLKNLFAIMSIELQLFNNNFPVIAKREIAEDRFEILNDVMVVRKNDDWVIVLTRLLCFAISGVNVILLGPDPSSG